MARKPKPAVSTPDDRLETLLKRIARLVGRGEPSAAVAAIRAEKLSEAQLDAALDSQPNLRAIYNHK